MSIHDNHRQRVKASYLAHGPDMMNDYQLLELYLFYSIPRADVNPLAHRLIDTFGSLAEVFAASIADLCQVQGVGESVAISIQLASQITARCQHRDASKVGEIISPEDAAEYLTPYFFGARQEQVYLLSVDAKGRAIHCDHLCNGSPSAASVDPQVLISLARDNRAVGVVLAHNHLSGSATPSQEDVAATKAIAKALHEIHVQLVDHLILADGDYVSLRHSDFMDWDTLLR
jgi:DNA repair protein RadC